MNGSISCSAPLRSSSETANPTSVRPRSAIIGAAAATSCRAVTRMVCVEEVAHGNVRDRVARPKSLNRNRNVTVRPVRPAARIRAGDPVDQVDHHRVDLGGRHGVAGAAKRALSAHRPSADARRDPTLIDVARQRAYSRRPIAPPTSEASVDSLSSATSATVAMPCACSLSAVLAPDAPEPVHRQRVQEVELAVRAAPAAGHPAWLPGWRPWRGTCVRAMPTVMGSPTRSRTSLPQPGRDLHRCARDAPQPGRRRGRLHPPKSARPAGWCRGRPRRPRRWPASRPTSWAAPPMACGHSRRAWTAAHRGAHTIGLGFVAGRQHHPAADDHRPAAQGRVVALLDGRVERVEVRVQDAGSEPVPDTNICSHQAVTDQGRGSP